MIKPRKPVIAFLAVAVALLASGAATAQADQSVAADRVQVAQGPGGERMGHAGRGRGDRNFGEVVSKRGTLDGNLFVAGENVSVDAEVDGDVLAFGETVVVGGRIAEDVLGAGETMMVRGVVAGDVRVAGETVTPTAEIGGDFMAAAQSVTVPGSTSVGGDAWLAGEIVAVTGAVAGDLYAAARRIRLDGPVGGDVDLRGETITIAATARIEGDLTYRSHRDITIEPGAEIGGDTIFVRTQGPRRFIGGLLAGIAAAVLAMLAGVVVLGALQVYFFPTLAAVTAGQLARRPWLTLGLGLAILLAGPVAIVLLATSVVGIPLTIVLSAAYIVAAIAGYLAAAGALGRYAAKLLHRDADVSYLMRLAAFVVGLVVLTVVGLIPVLGPLAVFLATAAGVGALLLRAREARPI